MKSIEISFHTIINYASDSGERPTVKSLPFESHFDFNKIEAISIYSPQDGRIGYVNKMYLQNAVEQNALLEEKISARDHQIDLIIKENNDLNKRLETLQNNIDFLCD